MDLTKELINVLNSRGNQGFQVLFNYAPANVRKRNVYVKLVAEKGAAALPVFGVYSNTNKRTEFVVLDNFIKGLESKLQNKVLNKFDFSMDFPNDDFIVELNEGLRLINIVQKHYSDLSKIIYKENVTSEIVGKCTTLSSEDVRILFNVFETSFSDNYLKLLDEKVIPSLTKSFNNFTIKTLNSLGKFVLVTFRGPCIINPLLECGKYSKVFKETKLYGLCLNNSFNVKDNVASFLTNREICESLSLDRYINYTSNQLVMLLLGVFNPSKYPSLQSSVYRDSDSGSVVTEVQYLREFADNPNYVRISTMYYLCLINKRKLKIDDMDLYFSIISNFNLA